jgi:hypothetical protein
MQNKCVECKDEKGIWIKAPWSTHADGTHPEELLCNNCYQKLDHLHSRFNVQGSQYEE